jgi:hypothetical protein
MLKLSSVSFSSRLTVPVAFLFSALSVSGQQPGVNQQPSPAAERARKVAADTKKGEEQRAAEKQKVRSLPQCSLTKTNDDCKLVIDRKNPLTPPAIQMYSNQTLTVIVARPKFFERYFLDYQSGQAMLTPDVASSIVQGLLPSLLKLQEISMTEAYLAQPPSSDDCTVDALTVDTFPAEGDPLTKTAAVIQTCAALLAKKAIPIYQALEPYVAPDSIVPSATPATVELVDIQDEIKAFVPLEVALSSRILNIATKFKASTRGKTVDTVQNLTNLQKVIDAVATDLTAYSQRITDLAGYSNGSEPCADLFDSPKGKQKEDESLAHECLFVQSRQDNDTVYNNMVTRSVIYGLDTLNLIANTQQAAPDPTKKKLLTTVTINFADTKATKSVVLPRSALRWEASAGAFFSTLPVRSFSVAPVFTNAVITNKVITVNILHPTVVPFAAANYRLTDDLKRFRWKSNIYLTGAVGINPNTVTADFATGISWSYRALMVSGLAHFGHEVSLTQGLIVGESLGPSFNGTLPTQTHWTTSFAIGLSVRIPSLVGR